MRRILCATVLFLALAMPLTACGEAQDQGLKDGYYTAQAAEYNFGWKEDRKSVV